MESIAQPYEYFDRRFYGLTNGSARLDELFTGLRWAEGPVWFNDGGYLLCSDIPNNRIMRWIPDQGASVFRANSNYSTAIPATARAGWSAASTGRAGSHGPSPMAALPLSPSAMPASG